MIKKIMIFLVCFLMVMMTIASVMANEDVVDISKLQSGDIIPKDLSLWDKIKMTLSGSGSFTVINNAMCSIHPDKSNYYTPSSSYIIQRCYINNLRKGVAYQMFRIVGDYPTSYQQRFYGELQIKQGEKKCFNVEYGVEYWEDFYYCDSTVERVCSDSDNGKNFNVFGKVNFNLAGENPTIEEDRCINNELLLEIYCDADKSVASILNSCKCVNGACVTTPTTPTTPPTTPTIPTTPPTTPPTEDKQCYYCSQGVVKNLPPSITGTCPIGTTSDASSLSCSGGGSGDSGSSNNIAEPTLWQKIVNWFKGLFSW